MGKFLIPLRHEGDSLTAIDSSPGLASLSPATTPALKGSLGASGISIQEVAKDALQRRLNFRELPD
jgi:hypothetical protein